MPVVDLHRSGMDQQAGRFDVLGHIGQKPLNALELRDMLAELLAGSGIVHSGFKTSLCNANSQRCDTNASLVQHAHHHVEATVHLAQKGVGSQAHIVEIKRADLAGALAHLVFLRATLNTFGMKVHDEDGHATVTGFFIRASQNKPEIRDRSVMDPDLAAVQDPAVAIAFAREGADVALSYLPDEEPDAQEIKSIIEASGRRAFLFPGDLSDSAFCTQLVADAVAALGGLDALVNNAGRQIAVERFEDLSEDQWAHTFETNIHAIYRVSHAAVPHMPAGSTIVNSTSIQAYQPSPHLLDYASTKAAINNFTKGLGQALAQQGIRVNGVAPGPIWTPLQVSDGQPKDALPEFGKDTPLGRAGQPTELAPAYVFLTSPESSYVIGETLNVNGGTPSP